MIRQKINNISGIILAGGANKRFEGKNKANTIIGGAKIITRITTVLEQIFEEIIIVTNSPRDFDHIPGCKITGDLFLNIGPLGGIHAAMKASTKEAVFVFACDMPFLNNDLIINQIKYYNSHYAQAVIPKINNYLEPLHGIYRNLLSDQLEEFLSSQTKYGIKDFLANIEVRFFKLNRTKEVITSFTNVNTPKEVQKWLPIF